ncbi:MAG TPA: membrane protein insertion efficiency factor YidD [Polyangiaceae bacterium]
MVARLLIFLIRVYQMTLSKLLGRVCRFEPSCSHYAAECLLLHGAARGSWLAVRRVARCHPFHPGGYDPPPAPRSARSRSPLAPAMLQGEPAAPVASGPPK